MQGAAETTTTFKRSRKKNESRKRMLLAEKLFQELADIYDVTNVILVHVPDYLQAV